MKKFLSTLLIASLCLSLLAGCSFLEELADSRDSSSKKESSSEAEETATGFFKTDNEISYVMIYNPNIYDENLRNNETLTTGDLADYVEAISNRGDELEAPEAPEFIPYSVSAADVEIPSEAIDLSGNRAGAMITPYSEGDIKTFYTFDESFNRTMRTFECRYAGTYCNIWTSDDYMEDSLVEDYGSEFDNNIYRTTVNTFGEPRFGDNGGKVNLLFTAMANGLGGCFTNADIYASGEVTPGDISRYMLNTDHAIVNINSLYAAVPKNKTFMFGTMAHEFQHQICCTNTFYTPDFTQMRVWLNEAMSGYIEEKLYPGTKVDAGHFESFATSDRIRHGQSMYNFATDTTSSKIDIGVYGSVYLFSEYLSNKAGDDVFSNVHDYWRTSYSDTLCEAEALMESVSSSVVDDIDGIITYGSSSDFETDAEEWMSKLTLDFYLSLLKYDKNDPSAYKMVKAQTLLYDEINAADIEGGGRVIVALKDGEFEAPEDADSGLVYVGLNEDFEVVTDYIYY